MHDVAHAVNDLEVRVGGGNVPDRGERLVRLPLPVLRFELHRGDARVLFHHAVPASHKAVKPQVAQHVTREASDTDKLDLAAVAVLLERLLGSDFPGE
ncbi:hypothetical protein D9M72_624000 [compost metagenome]